MFGLFKKLTQSEDSLSVKQKKTYIEKEIAFALAPLVAEMVRPSGLSKSSQKLAEDFFAKHFVQVSFNNIVDAVENYVFSGAQPFLKISCRQLSGLVEPESCKSIVFFLLQLAAADSFIHARKIRLAQRIAGYLGIAEADFNSLKANFISKNNPYFLLEVEETASLAEVKKAYRKMVLKFHPDKRSAYVSEKEASEKFLQIQAAFEAILKGYEME